jgi:hypothetical protein
VSGVDVEAARWVLESLNYTEVMSIMAVRPLRPLVEMMNPGILATLVPVLTRMMMLCCAVLCCAEQVVHPTDLPGNNRTFRFTCTKKGSSDLTNQTLLQANSTRSSWNSSWSVLCWMCWERD